MESTCRWHRHFELVALAGCHARNEDFPKPLPRIRTGVAATHQKLKSARRRFRPAWRWARTLQRDAGDAFEHERVSAQLLVAAQMGAFAEQIKIKVQSAPVESDRVVEIDKVARSSARANL